MAKLGPTIKLPEPDYGQNWKPGEDAHDRAFAAMCEFSAKATEKNPRGFILDFPVADGYAHYLVVEVKPLTLSHIPHGDAWTIPAAHIRGITLDDVLQQMRWRKGWDKLTKR